MDRTKLILAAALIIGGVMVVSFVFYFRSPPEKGPVGVPLTNREMVREPVHLYFADRSNTHLTAEKRLLPRPDDPAALARLIVEALIQGPETGLVRTLPETGGVTAVFITPDGVAFVDLDESIRKDHPGGSRTELLTVYSIVNSVVLNIAGVDSVKLLIGGQEADTLAGHISLAAPLPVNMMMVR